MKSLEVGKTINKILSDNIELNDIVKNKIYPIIIKQGTTYPFIVYRRTNIIPQYTKDYHLKDNVIIEISNVSDSYETSIIMASLVRNILEDKRFEGIESIKIESADEDYIDDAYIQTLIFNITIN